MDGYRLPIIGRISRFFMTWYQLTGVAVGAVGNILDNAMMVFFLTAAKQSEALLSDKTGFLNTKSE